MNVSLTFDNGPHPATAPGVVATFTQAFPRSCAPMCRGEVRWEMGMIDA